MFNVSARYDRSNSSVNIEQCPQTVYVNVYNSVPWSWKNAILWAMNEWNSLSWAIIFTWSVNANDIDINNAINVSVDTWCTAWALWAFPSNGQAWNSITICQLSHPNKTWVMIHEFWHTIGFSHPHEWKMINIRPECNGQIPWQLSIWLTMQCDYDAFYALYNNQCPIQPVSDTPIISINKNSSTEIISINNTLQYTIDVSYNGVEITTGSALIDDISEWSSWSDILSSWDDGIESFVPLEIIDTISTGMSLQNESIVVLWYSGIYDVIYNAEYIKISLLSGMDAWSHIQIKYNVIPQALWTKETRVIVRRIWCNPLKDQYCYKVNYDPSVTNICDENYGQQSCNSVNVVNSINWICATTSSGQIYTWIWSLTWWSILCDSGTSTWFIYNNNQRNWWCLWDNSTTPCQAHHLFCSIHIPTTWIIWIPIPYTWLFYNHMSWYIQNYFTTNSINSNIYTNTFSSLLPWTYTITWVAYNNNTSICTWAVTLLPNTVSNNQNGWGLWSSISYAQNIPSPYIQGSNINTLLWTTWNFLSITNEYAYFYTLYKKVVFTNNKINSCKSVLRTEKQSSSHLNKALLYYMHAYLWYKSWKIDFNQFIKTRNQFHT
jgi:hypothetical protein